MIPWLWLIFLALFGACVGSFLNVVICRLPLGQSLIHPGSHCPHCHHPIAWYDNIPVLSWLLLRARCRHCHQPISPQYPLVEAVTALLFAGYFYTTCIAGFRSDFSSTPSDQRILIFLLHLALIAGLLAATVIDARLFVIPLEIPWTCTVLALVVLPLSALFFPDSHWLLPPAPPTRLWPALSGATLGLILANILLWTGLLPRSFENWPPPSHAPPAHPPSSTGASPTPSPNPSSTPAAATPASHPTPQDWLAHPHPRREILKELLFLLPIFLGAVLGHISLTFSWPRPAWTYPLAYQALAGSLTGYFTGAALIWLTRLLGTLAFGKEAMGLGDVHLLAAIGSVLGWPDAILIFFLAPVIGLICVALLVLLRWLRRNPAPIAVLPYGPYLAAAALILMFFHDPLWQLIFLILGR